MANRISQVLPYVDEDELSLISLSIKNKWLTEGPYSQSFLEKIKDSTKSKYAVLAPNGTLGLYLALLALDLPKGSQIIIPSFTFFASASFAVFAGLEPIFVDVDEETFNIDVNKIEDAITEKTSAIMPVHIYGHSCQIDKIMEIASKHKLKVIEDAAQGLGVFYDGRHVGTFGDASMISFFADKTIATGEGAVVLTSSEDLYNRLLLLRNQGRPNSGTFIHSSLGMNFRMTDIQCAIGVSQLNKLRRIQEKKEYNYKLYREALDGVGDLKFLTVQENSTFVPFRFYIRTAHKAQLSDYLEKHNVQTRSFFYPMHLQPPLKKYSNCRLEVSEMLYQTGICLPLHSYLEKEDVLYIAAKIKGYFEGLSS